MSATPGKSVRSAAAGVSLPDVGRFVFQRRDARLRQVARLAQRPELLPYLYGDQLVSEGVDPAHLDAELHRLGHLLAPAYAAEGLPPAAAISRDDGTTMMVMGYVAAAPVWTGVLGALAEVDAAFAVVDCDELERWDTAVARPLAGFVGHRGGAAPEVPPLRYLTREAIGLLRAAMLAHVVGGETAEARKALDELWQRAGGLAQHAAPPLLSALPRFLHGSPTSDAAIAMGAAIRAVDHLRAEVADRRDTMIAIGEALDEAAGTGPRYRVAMTLAVRPLIARALTAGVAEWLHDLTAGQRLHPSALRITVESRRVATVVNGLDRGFSRTLEALIELLGMEP